MKKALIYFFINGASLYLISQMFQGIIIDSSSLIALTIIFTIVNTFIKPVLSFISFPFTVLTLGLFKLIINGVVLAISFALIKGAVYDSFFTLIVAGLVISILNILFSSLFGLDNDD